MSRLLPAALFVLLLSGASRTVIAGSGGGVALDWHDVSLPGGVAGLACALGTDAASVDAGRVLLETIRRLHAGRDGSAAAGLTTLKAYFDGLERVRTTGAGMRGAGLTGWIEAAGRGRQQAERRRLLACAGLDADGLETDLTSGPRLNLAVAEDLVPLPIAPEVWTRIVPGAAPGPNLVPRLLLDRGASLVYVGLAALDPTTLGVIAGDAALVREIHRGSAGVFAAFARSLRMEGDSLRLPGGPATTAAWESLVGESGVAPGRFIWRLLTRDRGRAAYFFDALSRLEPHQLRYALAQPEADAPVSEARFFDLYASFRSAAPDWNPAETPFFRPRADPAIALLLVRPDAEGRLASPAGRGLWSAVFGAARGRSAASEPLDAATLVAWISLAPPAVRLQRLETLLFAQRVFAGSRAAAPDLIRTLRAFGRMPALLLVLERMGIADPFVYARAIEQAEAVTRAYARHPEALASLQGALALLDRLRLIGTLDAPATERLLHSLLSIDYRDARRTPLGIGRWIAIDLLPAVAAVGEAAPDPEEILLRGLAGLRPADAPRPLFEWQGERFVVDPVAADLVRLRRAREWQGNPRLGDALDLLDRRSSEQRTSSGEIISRLLVSLVYALHMREPDAWFPLDPALADRHDFRAAPPGTAPRTVAAWSLPGEVRGAGGWRVGGSLLGLEIALGRFGLRRVYDEPPSPSPESAAATRAFMQTVMLLNPARMADASQARVARGIADGRRRVMAAPGVEALDRLAGEAGLGEWRRSLLRWRFEREPRSVPAAFSLLELLRLGLGAAETDDLDAWGVSMLAFSGCLCLRLPDERPWEDFSARQGAEFLGARMADLNLRVAVLLEEIGAPAALAAGVLAAATTDLLGEARPWHRDDWESFVQQARRLSMDRLEDYVSSLSAGGPLVMPSSGEGSGSPRP